VKTKAFCPIIISSTLLFGGCGRVDLTGVKSLSEQGVETTNQYPKVMKDLYDSCIRSVQYQVGAREIPLISQEDLTLGSIDGMSSRQPASSNPSKPTGTNLLKACIKNFKITKVTKKNAETANPISRAIVFNSVLQNYFLAIGKLAGIDVNLGKSTNDLASAVAGLLERSTTAKEQKEIKAGGQILGFIFDLIANKIRDDTLKAEITARNEDVTIVINALADTIISYKTQLSLEETQINDFYGGALMRYQSLRDKNEPLRNPQEVDETLPLLEALINTEWNKSRAIVREKRNIADDFIKTLQQLQESHDDISKTLSRISADDQLTDEEIKELNKVIAKHSRNLEPSLKNLEKDLQKLTERN
jgi:hypothetical protein